MHLARFAISFDEGVRGTTTDNITRVIARFASLDPRPGGVDLDINDLGVLPQLVDGADNPAAWACYTHISGSDS